MSEVPAIDPQAIADLRALGGGDDAFVVEIVELYLTDAPLRLADLDRSLAAGDAARARRTPSRAVRPTWGPPPSARRPNAWSAAPGRRASGRSLPSSPRPKPSSPAPAPN
jgi:hypothetical protein